MQGKKCPPLFKTLILIQFQGKVLLVFSKHMLLQKKNADVYYQIDVWEVD